MSRRTSIRDAFVNAFRVAHGDTTLRVPMYDVSVRYLTETEMKQSAVYCIVVTDETRLPSSDLTTDRMSVTIRVVCWANDDADPRGKLDDMIEDACRVIAGAARDLRSAAIAHGLTLEDITTDDGATASGPLAQAVLRFTAWIERPAIGA